MSLEKVVLKYRPKDLKLNVVLEDYKKAINNIVDFVSTGEAPFSDVLVKVGVDGDGDFLNASYFSRTSSGHITIAHSYSSTPPIIGGGDLSANRTLYLDYNTDHFQVTGTTFSLKTSGVDHGGLAGLADDDHTQYLLTDGTRTATGTLSAPIFNTTHASNPMFRWYCSGAGSNEKYWDFYSDTGGELWLRCVNDAYDAANVAMAFYRSGYTVSSCVISAPTYVVGPLCLSETTAPSNEASIGKIYVKSSDSKLYFQDDSGTEYDLTATGGSGDPDGDYLPAPFSGRVFGLCQAREGSWWEYGPDWSQAGTAPAWTVDADGHWYMLKTSTSAPNASYISINTGVAWQSRHNLFYATRVKTDATLSSNTRIWLGFADSSFANSDNLPGHGAAFRYSSIASDTNWKFVTYDGSTQHVVDTGVAVSNDTVYKFKCYTNDNGVTWNWWINSTSGSTTTNVPGTTTSVMPMAYLWLASGTTQHILYMSYVYFSYNG